jgi:hypothetical protein
MNAHTTKTVISSVIDGKLQWRAACSCGGDAGPWHERYGDAEADMMAHGRPAEPAESTPAQ